MVWNCMDGCPLCLPKTMQASGLISCDLEAELPLATPPSPTPPACPVRLYRCFPAGKVFIAIPIIPAIPLHCRWFPAGKVVFIAPTRPLVAQQMEACHKIMGIPKVRVRPTPLAAWIHHGMHGIQYDRHCTVLQIPLNTGIVRSCSLDHPATNPIGCPPTPQEDIVELTSAQNPDRRRSLWKSRRAFFCTPQILDNDLAKGVCPQARSVLWGGGAG